MPSREPTKNEYLMEREQLQAAKLTLRDADKVLRRKLEQRDKALAEFTSSLEDVDKVVKRCRAAFKTARASSGKRISMPKIQPRILDMEVLRRQQATARKRAHLTHLLTKTVDEERSLAAISFLLATTAQIGQGRECLELAKTLSQDSHEVASSMLGELASIREQANSMLPPR